MTTPLSEILYKLNVSQADFDRAGDIFNNIQTVIKMSSMKEDDVCIYLSNCDLPEVLKLRVAMKIGRSNRSTSTEII